MDNRDVYGGVNEKPGKLYKYARFWKSYLVYDLLVLIISSIISQCSLQHLLSIIFQRNFRHAPKLPHHFLL